MAEDNAHKEDGERANQLEPYPASDAILEKLEDKHGILWNEVEEVFESQPRIFKVIVSDQYGETRYAAYGQTATGVTFMLCLCTRLEIQ